VIGYVSKSPLKVGVKLSPETGKFLAEFNCEGLKIKTEGSVIGVFGPKGINEFNKKSTDEFSVNAKTEQVPKKFEGETKESTLITEINGEGPYESGQEAAAENTGEELTIKA
jgi:hypothetical protein